jgi:hypothetical protein
MHARPTSSWLGTLALLAGFALPTLVHADSDYVLSPAVRKIDADLARGAISVSQAAQQKLFYLFDRSRLAPEYAVEGTRPAKCGTAILTDIAAHRNELDADTRALYDQMVQGGGGNEINLAHTVETTHFSITYQDAGTSAVPLADVAPANGIPDYVEHVMAACEQSWSTEIDALGFLPPVLAGGPNNKYQITFQSQSSYGFTTPTAGGRTRIVLHPNYLGFPPNDDPEGDQLGAMKVTVAHEFKHASQYSYTAWGEGNWVELDATWVEDIVYDQTNDYYNYIFGADSPFTNPELPLDNGGSGLYEDANWEHYQTEKLGNAEMVAWWNRRLSFPGEPVLTTYAQNLVAFGSNFNDAFGEYAVWNFTCGAHSSNGSGFGYGEATTYPTTPAASTHTSLPIATTAGSVQHLAANTRLVLTGGILSGAPEFTFNGAAATPWRVTIVALKNNGSFVTAPMPLLNGAGVFLVTDPQFDLSNVRWVAMVIANPATAGVASNYTFAIRAVAPVFVSHAPLWDTPDHTNPRSVLATFSNGTTTLDASSPYLTYHVDAGANVVVPMTPTGNPGEYTAPIPAQAVGANVFYRITAASTLGDSVRTPADPTAYLAYQTVTVFEPFESAGGWTVGDVGDAATTGVWERVVPIASQAAPDADFTGPPGTFAFVTQNGPVGGAIGVADVDGGKTTLRSPVFDLASGGPYTSVTARYRRWYWNRLGGTQDDVWRADVSNDGGTNWTNVETIADGHGGWDLVNVDLMALFGAPAQVRFRFIAEDALGGSVVEGGIDDFEIIAIPVPTVGVGSNSAIAAVQLGPAMPNPAMSNVAVSLSLPQAMPVKATIRDVQGRTIRTLVDGTLPAGATTLHWNGAGERGSRVPAGVYFLRVATSGTSIERKLVFVH